MYKDDFYDEFDVMYEEFRSDSGHITNFSPEEEAAYTTAIEEYTQVHPEVKMHIDTGYKWPNTKGLYVTENGEDLSNFWNILKRIQTKPAEVK